MRIPTCLGHTRLSAATRSCENIQCSVHGDPTAQEMPENIDCASYATFDSVIRARSAWQSSLGQRDAAAPAVNNALNLARRLPIVGMMSTAYRQSVGHNRISALHSQQSPKWTDRLTSSATALLKHKAATGLRLPENLLCQQQADLINLVTHFTASCWVWHMFCDINIKRTQQCFTYRGLQSYMPILNRKPITTFSCLAC